MSKKHKDEYLQGTNYKLVFVFVVIFAVLALAIGFGIFYFASQSTPEEPSIVTYPTIDATPTLIPTSTPIVVDTPTPIVVDTPTPTVVDTPTPIVVDTPTPTVAENQTGVANSDLKIHFENIGQGDCILLDHNGRYALIDVGKTKTALDPIKKHQQKHYDWILTTHQDADHIGYASYVIENSVTDCFYDNGNVANTQTYKNMMQSVSDKDVYYHTLSTGDTINTWDDVKISVISSTATDGKNVNDDSIVLLLEFEGVRVAFTGDISQDVETNIGKALGDVDILKVAHHGSKTSSSAKFLEYTLPEVSVITVGENSYGHPSKEAVERLSKYGTIYRTDEYGCVEIVIDDGKYEVKHCEY